MQLRKHLNTPWRSALNRKKLFHWISGIAGLGLVVYLALTTGVDELLNNLSRLNPVILIPLGFVYSLSWVFRSLRFRKALEITGFSGGFKLCFSLELASDLINQVIPARLGDVTKVLYLKKNRGLDYTRGTFAAFASRVSDLFAVTLLTLLSSLFISTSVVDSFREYLLVFSVMVFLMVPLGLGFIFRPRAFSILFRGPLKKLEKPVINLSGTVRGNPHGTLQMLFLSVAVWLFDVLTLYIFLQALGIQLTVAETVFAMMLAYLFKALPVTPNGLGLYESMMVVILGALGVGESLAFSAAVLDHGFMNIWSILLALPALAYLGSDFREAEKLAEKSSSIEEEDD